jgi:hypothetical protein
MRLRWCALALRAFVRRWGVYIVVTGLVASAGSSTPVAVLAGLSAWLVMPLFQASAQGAWLLPATLMQALAGAALVWGARSLLWPPAWGEAERALPVEPGQRWRSDLFVVGVALLPLALLYAAGAMSVLAARPAWLQPTQGRAVVALVLALAGSLGLGVLLLQRLRRAPSPGTAEANGGALVPAAPGAAGLQAAAWPLPLLLRPLWRGPARRTGQVLALGTLALCGAGVAMRQWPAATAWWLVLLALGALLVVTRANGLARQEFAALFEACRVLPLSDGTLQRGRRALCLLPLLPAGLFAAAGLWDTPVRPGVLAAYALVLAGSCLWEVRAVAAEPADKASRWLFSLGLCVVLATEVLP